MSSKEQVTNPSAPLSTATRQRLQKVYEHAQRCVTKNDYDYANQLFTQCVAEDPGNLVYLQSFFDNLHKKYSDNKKGARLARVKINRYRSSLAKAANQGNWEAAMQAGCAALSLNPWDIPTLLAMSQAASELKLLECQLYYLRCGLNVDSKHVELNRQAAYALQQMGQFDQAIACWRRVQQNKPDDDEAKRAISQLSVEKTIQEGGYDSDMIAAGQSEDQPTLSVARFSRSGKQELQTEGPQQSAEETWKAAIEKDPTEIDNYVQLADYYLRQQQFDTAERVLGQAQNAAGGGDPLVRERLEDIQLRRSAHQLAIAEQRVEEDPSEENKALAARLRSQANQVDLEIYAARADRDPHNLRIKYELGLRLKRAEKFRDAISAFQAARGEPRRKVQVLLELGECFQRIEQYKLALNNYEQAIEASQQTDTETYRLCLYRAGVLSTGMRQFDRAEKHLTTLAALDYGYRDVAERLDKLAQIRNSS